MHVVSYSLVTEAEFCWVLDRFEPATRGELAEYLPTSNSGVYMRLRRLDGAYVTHTELNSQKFEWSLTDAGRELATSADLPPIEEIDLEEYFAGRTTSLNPNTILHEIAIHDAEWVPTSALYDALPYAKSTVRVRLIRMHDDGVVKRDDSEQTNQWRLTEAGREQLAAAEETTPRGDDERIFEQRPLL